MISLMQADNQQQIGLRVEVLKDGFHARLLEPYSMEAFGKQFTVPEGFETDFASVPRLFWRIVPPWGRYSPAAVVHDYLYATGLLPRCEADQVFLALMRRLGCDSIRSTLMYWAVRVFGQRCFDNHRGEDEPLDA